MDIGDWLTLLVAVCALTLTMLQAFWQRRHDRGAVRPLLKIHLNYQNKVESNRASIEITVTNLGLGPAIITSSILTKAKKETTFKAMAEQVLVGRKGSIIDFFDMDGTREAIIAGDTLVLLNMDFPVAEDKRFIEVIEQMYDFNLRIKYTSILGDKYKSIVEDGASLRKRFT
ncbi:hypothetical protein [Kordiimonas aquimaris]|uniref:hypothetical protein n=1 Tax=Kordiimonas aquimaris TaxID=707591 RepID=UPI0021D243E6|nr:hypothetical protein [Kordiimonas aquimaris]